MYVQGTIHHGFCPKCKSNTVDKNDGECKNAYCDEDELTEMDDYEAERLHQEYLESLEYPKLLFDK